MTTIFQISDCIIFKLKFEGNTGLSTLKHQKLLYYIQAWYLAFYNKKFFDNDFEAWIHGPVNRDIYDLYKENKCLYSEMSINDIQDIDSIEKISKEDMLHVDTILEAYAKYSATELENMTHNEQPWQEARVGKKMYERCDGIISNDTIKNYYSSLLDEKV